MNLIRVHQCGDGDCLSQQKDEDKRTTFMRTVYQVDASKICEFLKSSENQCLHKSFAELLYLASIDRQGKTCAHQEDNLLLLTNVPDLISIAIHWKSSECTTSDIENLVSIINPLICLRELFYDVTNSDARLKQLNLIGLICFYGTTIEVFFSYEPSTSKWHFCCDGNLTVVNDWNDVRRQCIDFHLQPFLLIYANSEQNSIDITQLLKRTVIQAKIIPSERRLVHPKHAMKKQERSPSNKSSLKRDLYSLDNLSKISSFATLNSSMLFLPKSTSTYINQETVAKVMQQQLLKKESLSDTQSMSSSSTCSPLVHIRQRYHQKHKFDDALSSGDSSTSSSQRDSGLGSGINDGSSDDSPRDSLAENDQTEIDGLIKQTGHLMNENYLDLLLTSIEYYLEQSLKYESASNYSSAVDSCQKALVLLDQIRHLSNQSKTDLSIYTRTRKNSLLLRIRTLRNRQIQHEELNSRFQSVENVEKKSKTPTTSILLSTTRLSRPKKNVKFSDSVALIVPTSDDTIEPPSEHLIHSFLRQFQPPPPPPPQKQTTSDSDSDTPSSSSSSNDVPIGLSECSLCHKRFSKSNQIATYCSNCHFYMQRFQPPTNS